MESHRGDDRRSTVDPAPKTRATVPVRLAVPGRKILVIANRRIVVDRYDVRRVSQATA
jgi:hypothetical protein